MPFDLDDAEKAAMQAELIYKDASPSDAKPA
jgi:hypothetical protein